MGVVANISEKTFPKQGAWLRKTVNVCFNYDTSVQLKGQIVREDEEAPGLTIIRLEDGRHVLSTECQFEVLKDS